MYLHSRNIILDCHGKAWLIDWAFARMYPASFETATISRHGGGEYFKGLLDLLGDENSSELISRLFAISFALTSGAAAQTFLEIQQCLGHYLAKTNPGLMRSAIL
jgi:hypothetical protein